MYKFVYDGNPIEVDINKNICYKIEDDIMTLYENGYLVDNSLLLPGNAVCIVESDDSNAHIFIEDRVANDEGYNILKSMGLDDVQIDKITSSDSENYQSFLKILSKARNEVETDQTKDLLRDSLGMTDEQIEQLINSDEKGFKNFAKFINKGKKMVNPEEGEKDLSSDEETPELNPDLADLAGDENPEASMDMPEDTNPENSVPEEQPTETPEEVPAEQPQPTDPNAPAEQHQPEQPQPDPNAQVPAVESSEEGTSVESTTLLQLLPQIGTNVFNDDTRYLDKKKHLPLHHFHNVIENYIDDIDMEYTSEVEESVIDVAKRIKGTVDLSLHVRKLAIDIAVLNSKYYVAKKFNKNKLKAVNIKRKMLKLQAELNKIKEAASYKEKQEIIKLQKEAFAKAKEETKERLKANTKTNKEKTITKESTNDTIVDIKEPTDEITELRNKYDEAKTLYESTGEPRYEKKMRGIQYHIDKLMTEAESNKKKASVEENILSILKKLIKGNWESIHFYAGYNTNNKYTMKFYYIDKFKKHIDQKDIKGLSENRLKQEFIKIDKLLQKERNNVDGEKWTVFTLDATSDGGIETNFEYASNSSKSTVSMKKENVEEIDLNSTFLELFNDLGLTVNEIM